MLPTGARAFGARRGSAEVFRVKTGTSLARTRWRRDAATTAAGTAALRMTSPPSDGASIVFDRATFRLNGRALVQDLELSVNPGETLVLLGRSGSGKTTSLKLVNRLLEPTGGEVRVNG